MRALSLLMLLLGLTVFSTVGYAATIKVEGMVRELNNAKAMKGALVRLYKDGLKIYADPTSSNGKFQFKLQNNAVYVIRVSAPGHITKCFQIDTRGSSWVGDNSVNSLKVEMNMMEQVEGFDHSFFDMPLGLAKYNPVTGYLAWNKKYEGQLEPELIALMEEYGDKLVLLASIEHP